MNITLWSKYNSISKQYEYNHFEEGLCQSDKPTPLHPNHKSWASYKWTKQFAKLIDNKVVY